MKPKENMPQATLSDDEIRIAEARHHDPFAVLGKHSDAQGALVCVYIPRAVEVSIAEGNHALERVGESDFFKWRGAAENVPDHYRLIWLDDAHRQHIAHDPYAYPPQLSEFDLHLFSEGKHHQAYRFTVPTHV